MKIQCPAKVNLFLEIVGKRRDGYHELATLFAKIHLYDVLELSPGPGAAPTLEIINELDGVLLSAGPDNLVLRAAAAFYRLFKVKRGVRLQLIKRIPMGAGLGGGSSDAAGTFLGLAKFFSIALTAPRLRALKKEAAKLGADIPFFLNPAPFCLGAGIGERLKPLSFAKSLPYMLLAWPGVSSPTGPVYAALPVRAPDEVRSRLNQLDRLLRALKRGRPVSEWSGLLFNRLEQAEVPVLARVEQARRILEAAGAKGARMSGSGSSVFGFVSSHAEGERLVRRLRAYPWKVYLTSCLG